MYRTKLSLQRWSYSAERISSETRKCCSSLAWPKFNVRAEWGRAHARGAMSIRSRRDLGSQLKLRGLQQMFLLRCGVRLFLQEVRDFDTSRRLMVPVPVRTVSVARFYTGSLFLPPSSPSRLPGLTSPSLPLPLCPYHFSLSLSSLALFLLALSLPLSTSSSSLLFPSISLFSVSLCFLSLHIISPLPALSLDPTIQHALMQEKPCFILAQGMAKVCCKTSTLTLYGRLTS